MTTTVVIPATMSYDGTQHTYTDDSDPTTGLDGGGHVERFTPAMKDVVSVANYVATAATSALGGATTNSTSSTSLTIGTGSKALTLAETGKAYVVGQYVIIASTANPANKMVGQVTAFSGVTLTVNVASVTGSGTIAAWSISVTGAPASAGQTAFTPAGSISSTDVQAAIVELDSDITPTKGGTAGQVAISQGNGVMTFRSLSPAVGTWNSWTVSNTFTAPYTGYFRFYALSKGGNGYAVTNTSAASGGGSGMAYGDILMTAGQVATITISATQTTVTVDGVVMLTANKGGDATAGIAGTAGTASKDASVLNGGAFSGGAGATLTSASACASGGSSGSPIGIGVSGLSDTAGVGGTGWGGVGGVGANSGGGGVGGAGNGANAGGSGGAASNGQSGIGRTFLNRFTDPLLVNCISSGSHIDGVGGSAGFFFGAHGEDGCGGMASNITGSYGGNGGLGGGGGTGLSSCGIGGFGASGAVKIGVNAANSGYGAGSSANANNSKGTAGTAICLVYY